MEAGEGVQRERASGSAFPALDPRELAHALRKRRWLILASTLLVAGAVALGTMRQPKVYRAAARIIIDPVLPKVLGDAAGDIDNFGERASAEYVFLNTQYKIIQGRTMLRATIQRLGLTRDERFLTDHGLTGLDEERLLKAGEAVLRRSLLVEPESHSRIVNLVVEDFDHERAAKIANALASTYIDYSLERRVASTRKASGWLDERVEEYSARLEEAERSLYEFKKMHLLVSFSFEDRRNITAASLGTYSEKLIEARTKLVTLEAERRILRDELSREGPGIESIPRVARSPVVTSIKALLADLERQRAELSARYGEKHPAILALGRQEGEARERLGREVELVAQQLDNEIEEEKRAEASLHEKMETEREKAVELNKLVADYAKITQEHENTKKTYEYLLKRRTEADLSEQLETNFVDWHEPAEATAQVVRPSLQGNVVLGALVGLLIGLLVVVLGVLLDNTVHTQEDVEGLLGQSFLGVLPTIGAEEATRLSAAPESRDLYIAQDPKSTVAECARSLRTNLLFLGTEHPLKRLLLTSAGPSEGKTTTAIALGITFAQAKNRVLLVDTDLRRPRLHRTFGVSGQTGLTNLLFGGAALEEAIKSTDIVGLDLLPCGPLPPNPAELLHSERFRKTMETLEERYDLVLLDSPPVNAVTDSAILAQQVHGTILVVKASKTTKDAVRRAVRQLADVNARILGVVLNDLDLSEGGYYNDYYRYYYRRYAYGSDAKERA